MSESRATCEPVTHHAASPPMSGRRPMSSTENRLFMNHDNLVSYPYRIIDDRTDDGIIPDAM